TYVGLLKAFIFGIMVSTISCANGLRATNGALGVGKATRNSVVSSFLMVLIVGYYITGIFYGKTG
ncbi:MAG TPA: ABC transporter permease, partial [Spirochaetota bacterium]|nr:ABC transporter permease [Spirochaetota bacterium]